MTVSDLLEQPCNKSDNAINLVPNLLQQLGTSSVNTTCRQLVNRFVTTCLQTCNNLCLLEIAGRVVLECVAGGGAYNLKDCRGLLVRGGKNMRALLARNVKQLQEIHLMKICY
jgi:hypothetical protein